MNLKTFSLLIAAIILSACTSSSHSTIRVENAWARPTTDASMGHMHGESSMGGSTSAIYMIIYNDTGNSDRLIAASSPVAEIVEIHETRMENDIMRMQQVDGIDLPAKGKVELKPGGYHIMLINTKQDLKAGDKISFTLVFEKLGELTLQAEVRTP